MTHIEIAPQFETKARFAWEAGVLEHGSDIIAFHVVHDYENDFAAFSARYSHRGIATATMRREDFEGASNDVIQMCLKKLEENIHFWGESTLDLSIDDEPEHSHELISIKVDDKVGLISRVLYDILVEKSTYLQDSFDYLGISLNREQNENMRPE